MGESAQSFITAADRLAPACGPELFSITTG